jgi:hypothetical protein
MQIGRNIVGVRKLQEIGTEDRITQTSRRKTDPLRINIGGGVNGKWFGKTGCCPANLLSFIFSRMLSENEISYQR